MKKSLIIFFIIFSVFVIGLSLIVANAFFGNPISKALAKNAANKYIKQHYNEADFEIYDIFYNFKDGYYHAEVISPTSEDSHFYIALSGQKVVDDTFEEDVLSGWNTWQRLDEAYRQLTDQLFEDKNFPLKSEISFGTIESYEDIAADDFITQKYGVVKEELKLDKDYDIKHIAKTAGKIVFYAQHDEISFEKASELLLTLKDEFDQADIPFYAIDFILEKPHQEDGSSNEDDSSIHTANFLYEDIYEKDLKKRIKQNHQLLMEYYEEQDKYLEKNSQ